MTPNVKLPRIHVFQKDRRGEEFDLTLVEREPRNKDSERIVRESPIRTARQTVLRMLGSDPWKYEFDSTLGIPMMDYGNRCGIHIGRQVNPLIVALYGCKALHLDSTVGPILVPDLEGTRGQRFIQNAVDWLVSNEKREGGLSVWEHKYPWLLCSNKLLQPPWRSALAEAFGSLLLLSAGKAEDARRHLKAMLTDYKKGGTAYPKKNSLWLLEYVSDERVLVLNGMMSCLVILHECSLRLGDSKLKDAFDLAYASMKRDLHLFDAGFHTYYDSHKNPADSKYNYLHVELLRILWKRTRDPNVRPWIERWMRYQKTYPIMEPIIFLRHMIRSRGTLLI
jgi:hypothetical protein